MSHPKKRVRSENKTSMPLAQFVARNSSRRGGSKKHKELVHTAKVRSQYAKVLREYEKEEATRQSVNATMSKVEDPEEPEPAVEAAPRPRKHQRSKPNPMHEAEKALKRARREQEEQREREEQEAAQRAAEKSAAKQRRNEKRRKAMRRTNKGQPVMASVLERLMDKYTKPN
eukprot:CAMPEP_0175901368 /NCGR_PEP_ID=MMETSP0108-20121206/2828_1 /TAXON_ID=195067 ORGANISM="Goniomonas pacifica, Strain CCMP1869" /NCGR_SAMPLE_ID=MMETSP0108 /ASSEMBLY_ACC=CAM_ASM_000204 /LENGTH=171 /DNA_ID=CAMNT_0017222953 /DNA_START=6 /DNA_END=521 /DNA_ORIENTATION=-